MFASHDVTQLLLQWATGNKGRSMISCRWCTRNLLWIDLSAHIVRIRAKIGSAREYRYSLADAPTTTQWRECMLLVVAVEWKFIDPMEASSVQQEPGFGNVVQLGVNLPAVELSIQSDDIGRQPVKADLHFLSLTSL